MLLRRNFAFLVGGVAAMLLSTTAGAQTTFERVKREGVIKVGYSNESPWAFKRPDGTLAGVDFEVATVLFKKLGINKTEDVVTNFGSLIPGLKAGRFDTVLAGLYIRPARCKEIGFSEPTIQVLDGLLVLKGNPLKLHSHADIAKNPAVKVATVQGTVSGKNALQAGVPPDRVLEFTEFSVLVSALRTGRIQGVVMSAVSVNEMAAADGGKTVERAMPFAAPIFDGKPAINYSAIGFRLEDKDLIAAYNKVAKDFKRSPEHLAILKGHGLTETEVAADGVTTADLCKE